MQIHINNQQSLKLAKITSFNDCWFELFFHQLF